MLQPGYILLLESRCYDKVLNNSWGSDDDVPKKRCRESGAGRKAKAPEVRKAMFEWFLDVRGAMEGRLPMKIFRKNAKTCMKIDSRRKRNLFQRRDAWCSASVGLEIGVTQAEQTFHHWQVGSY